jgi:hypothetical protein
MDTQHSQPPNLATRLRSAKLDERVAALLAAAVGEEFGVDLLWVRDPAGAQRLTAFFDGAARRAGPCAVNKFALELQELLADAPDVRDLLARPHPELAPA